MFFSEEKNQKTFAGAIADRAGGTNTLICKSLLLLFFRKEDLTFFPQGDSGRSI
jgi:hypothetical protein